METAREFARKEIVPVAGELDEHGTFPTEICKKAWETGLMNCELPEAYGGPRAVVPGALPGARGDLVRLHRRQHDAGRQHARDDADHHRRHRGAEEEVPRAAARRADLRHLLLLRARRRLRRGRHEDALQASRATTTSSTARSAGSPTAASRASTRCSPVEEGSTRHKGITCFIVERDTPGRVASARRRTRWGSAARTRPTSSSKTSRSAKANILGPEGEGFKVAMETFDRTRPWIAAGAAGLIRRALDESPQLRARAQDVRRADRAAPGDPVHARRDGDRLRGDAPACHKAAWAIDAGQARQHRLELRQGLRRRRGDAASRPTPCRSSAATATRRSTRSRS